VRTCDLLREIEFPMVVAAISALSTTATFKFPRGLGGRNILIAQQISTQLLSITEQFRE
jgi:hypothetical protein